MNKQYSSDRKVKAVKYYLEIKTIQKLVKFLNVLFVH